MGVRASFVADFSRFATEVDKAVTRLKTFDDGIGRIDKELSKFGNQFSGRTVIQQTALMEKAIADVGGASKLTASEQARVNAQVTEAIAKYRALGESAPKSLIDLEKATKQVEQATSGLTTKMVAVGSAIGSFVGTLAADAVRKLGSEVVQLAANGVKLAPVVTAFERLTVAAGETADAMLGEVRTATKGLVTDLDIMAVSNKAILLGLPVTATEMGLLATTASTLGRAMKQDAAKSLDDLVSGLGRSSPLILDNLGLIVKVGEANEKYATELGKSSAALTDAEKKLAFYNAAMDAARMKVADLGGVQLTLADQVTRVSTIFTNFTDALGVAVARSPVLSEMLGSLADSLGEAFGGSQVTRVQTLMQWVDDLALSVVGVSAALIDVGRVGTRTWTLLQDGTLGLLEAQFRVRAGLRDLIPTERYTQEAAELRAMADSLRDQAGEALDRQSGLEAAFDASTEAIGRMRQRMIEASKTNASAATITEDLTRKTDDLGDAFKGSGEAAKKAAKEVADWRTRLADAELRLINQRGEAVEAAAAKELDWTRRLADAKLRLIEGDAARAEAAMHWVKVGGETAEEEARRVDAAIGQLYAGLHENNGTWLDDLDALGKTFTQLSTIAGDSLSRIAGELGQFIVALKLADESGKAFANGIAQWREGERNAGVISMAAGAASGAAALDQATASGGRLSRVGKGAASGAAAGSVAGPWGAAIGAGVGALVGLFRGPSQGEKTNDARDNWLKQFEGGSDGLRKLAMEAGIADAELRKMFGAKKVQEFEAAAESVIGKINEFNETQLAGNDAVLQKQQLLNDAIARYGFELREIGPALQQKELVKTAEMLLTDFQLLTGAGIDVTDVIRRMGEQIDDFVDNAVALGQEVPESMRGMLEAMVEQGLLTDDADEKLRDLSEVKFGLTLEEQFSGLLTKLDELISKLGTAGGLLTNLPAPDWSVPSPPDWDQSFDGQPYGFKGGTGGRYLNFGAGTPAILHGRERVMTESEGQSDGDLLRELRGLRKDAENDRVALPTIISMAVRSSSQLGARRR